MTTLTNILKNSVTLSNFSKNNANVSNKNNVNILSFLVTPNLNKILVGSTEADTLILWGDLSFTNLIKH